MKYIQPNVIKGKSKVVVIYSGIKFVINNATQTMILTF